MNHKELYELAVSARSRAYTPYSHFTVGAALLTKSGKVYLGCNIENAAYGAVNCAERTAFFTAICEGERDFAMIAIAGGREGEEGELCAPCGICRQVLAEFCTADLPVILGTPDDWTVHPLGELLPMAFTKQEL